MTHEKKQHEYREQQPLLKDAKRSSSSYLETQSQQQPPPPLRSRSKRCSLGGFFKAASKYVPSFLISGFGALSTWYLAYMGIAGTKSNPNLPFKDICKYHNDPTWRWSEGFNASSEIIPWQKGVMTPGEFLCQSLSWVGSVVAWGAIVPFNLVFILNLFTGCCKKVANAGLRWWQTNWGVAETIIFLYGIIFSGLVVGEASGLMAEALWFDRDSFTGPLTVRLTVAAFIGYVLASSDRNNLRNIKNALVNLYRVSKRCTRDEDRLLQMLSQAAHAAQFTMRYPQRDYSRNFAKIPSPIPDGGICPRFVNHILGTMSSAPYTNIRPWLGMLLSIPIFAFSAFGVFSFIEMVAGGCEKYGIHPVYANLFGVIAALYNALLWGPSLHYGAIQPLILKNGFIRDFVKHTNYKEKLSRSIIRINI